VADDGVRDLRDHVDAAHRAAERLVQEAADRAAAADAAFRAGREDVPENGWATPGDGAPREERPHELQVVVELLGAVRDAIPPELSAQLAEALRELLVAVRALIDWYLDRLDRAESRGGGAGGPGDERVRDIPIA
jgi:hypothetical protein